MAIQSVFKRPLLKYVSFLIFASTLSLNEAYKSYQERLPNGNNIPHPCKINYMWKGVGHENNKGGGALNRFGSDFANIGKHTWTTTLCQMDSDGDGLTNGQELGDPRCVWREGQVPERTINITHPGICDPYGSAKCAGQDTFVSCELDDFSCDTINRTQVKHTDVTFPRTKVPAEETTYMCVTADIPTDGDYFLIAAEAMLDNVNVMHHAVVYGCTDQELAGLDYSTPKVCPNGMKPCQKTWMIWTVGLSGVCLPENIGFRFGQNGFTKVMLEFHWNNPFKVDTYYDSSGMRLYYESNRPNLIEAGVASILQSDLVIPPGQPSIKHTGICSSECSKVWLNQPIKVFDLMHHMHYLGKSQVTSIFRNGTESILKADRKYSYDSPVVHRFDPTFEIRPGDYIETECEYTSMSKKIWTYSGLGTSDEMCVSFLMYYPATALTHGALCGSMGKIDICYADYSLGNVMPKYCPDYNTYFQLNNGSGKALLDRLRVNCNADDFCRPECAELVKEIKGGDCYKNGIWEILNRGVPKYPAMYEFIARMNSCKEVECDDGNNSNSNHNNHDNFVGDDVRDDGVVLTASKNLLLAWSFVVCTFIMLLHPTNVLTI